MQWYEIKCLLENMWRKEKESWEQTRTVAYVTAQSQSTKQLDMQKMMPFHWEKSKTEELPTQEERDEVYKEMKAMEEMMNKK